MRMENTGIDDIRLAMGNTYVATFDTVHAVLLDSSALRKSPEPDVGSPTERERVGE